MRYKIKCVDATGKEGHLTIESTSEQEALAEARQQGYFPTEVSQVPASASPKTPLAHRSNPSLLSDAVVNVRVVDFEMEFGSMVRFLVKITLAAIPAMLILATIWAFVAIVFTSIFFRS